jgi:hypothetical protein
MEHTVGRTPFADAASGDRAGSRIARDMHGTSLAGAWKLLVFEFRSEGQVVFPFGTNFSGLCLYDTTGYMSMQIMRGDRPRFAVNDQQAGAPDEVAAAFTGCYSYFGTYVVDETHGVVVHHVAQSLFPNWIGTDQVRFYRISGERLIVAAPTQQVRGHLMDAMLVWERVQAVERH